VLSMLFHLLWHYMVLSLKICARRLHVYGPVGLSLMPNLFAKVALTQPESRRTRLIIFDAIFVLPTTTCACSSGVGVGYR